MNDYIPGQDDDGNHCFVPKSNIESIGYDMETQFYYATTKDGRRLRVSPAVAGECTLIQLNRK